MSEFRHAPAIEPTMAPEMLVTDLVRAERFGSFVRLTFGTPDSSLDDMDRAETLMIVSAKLVVPADCLDEIVEKLTGLREVSPPPERKRPREKPKLIQLHHEDNG